MALTATQRAQVRRLLGFPDVNRERYHRLEGAMTALSAEGEAEVVAKLTSLTSIDTTLTASWSRQKAKRVEDIHLAGFDEIAALRDEGNRLVCDIATVLGVQPRKLPYSTPSSGYAGRG